MTSSELSKLQALPFEEKLWLMDALWMKSTPTAEPAVTEAEKRELDSRWARFERDPSRALTLEQFRALVKAKRG
jgi:putative addiction module component (TIGR02574 family)